MAEDKNLLFWYRLIDVLHASSLGSTPSLGRGTVAVSKSFWIDLFYAGKKPETASRAWERWKQRARKIDLIPAGPGILHEGEWWMQIDVRKAEAQINGTFEETEKSKRKGKSDGGSFERRVG